MYETIEFYDSNVCDLKEVLKNCIYKYYLANKNSLRILEKELESV